jgi:hypothetical protein
MAIQYILCASFIALLACLPLAYATNESPYKTGYTNGLHDGKDGGAIDPSPVCAGYNSTADANACYHAYGLGFKKSCSNNHDVIPDDEHPEYPTCAAVERNGLANYLPH